MYASYTDKKKPFFFGMVFLLLWTCVPQEAMSTVTMTEVIRWADTEEDILNWMNRGVYNHVLPQRYHLDDGRQILVLLGYGGSGIVRVTIFVYVFSPSAPEWSLALYVETLTRDVHVEIDQNKNALVFRNVAEEIVLIQPLDTFRKSTSSPGKR